MTAWPAGVAVMIPRVAEIRKHGMVRVIDETGEGDRFPANLVAIDSSRVVR